MTLPARPRWYHHIDAVSASLECEGTEHRVSWQRGKFVLHDHDLSAERAMLVLGGEPSPCLKALRMWRDQFGMPPEIFLQMHTWLGEAAALAPPEMELPRQLGMTLSWARSWRHWRYLDKHGGLLQTRAVELALPLFREHLLIERQRFGCRVISSAKVQIVPDTDVVGATGRMDKVRVTGSVDLHPSWLVEVWPRGFAVVDGAFVIDIEEDSRERPIVRAIRWDDRGEGMRKPVTALARLSRMVRGDDGDDDGDRGDWSLTWEEPPSNP